MKRHLEPLAIAANVTQASFCRLDQVLLTFGFLVMQYRSMTDHEDVAGCSVIIASIEKRWEKTDQEIFIAAVLLNPFYRSAPFATLPFLNNAGIHALLDRLWTRFYQQPPPMDFYEHVNDYLKGTGYFYNLESHCRNKLVQADRNVCHITIISRVVLDFSLGPQNESPDPLVVYEDFSFAGHEPPAFILLARRILSICANSASCERLFSIFGTTLTKLRNRLGMQTMTAISELKMHIRDENIRNQTKTRLKREFATRTSPSSTVDRSAAALSTETYPEPQHDDIAGGGGHPDTEPSNQQPDINDFRAIVDQHSRSVDEDNCDNEPITASTTALQPIKIVELFDFTQSHWVTQYSKTPQRSFGEELELYELLDQDGEGGEDVNIDIDDTTADVLLG
jgi:hypothetical protein